MDIRVIFIIAIIILISTSIYLYFDGKKYRKTILYVQEKKISDDEYKNKITRAIRYMSGYEFEDFMVLLFNSLGHKAKRTKGSGDMGKDIILDKNCYVECKCFSKGNVTSPMVNKLIGSAVSDGISKCMFVTTNGYTKDALKIIEKASDKINIERWYLDDILRSCMKVNRNRILNYLEKI